MPQLNPEFFVSQLFWLVVSFSFLLVFLWRISLPRIESVLDKRERKINDDISAAKKLQEEAEEIQNQLENDLEKAKTKSQDYIKKSVTDFNDEIEKKLLSLDKEIEISIMDSNREIEKNKRNLIQDVKDQIQEIVSFSIKKITDENIEIKK